MAAITLQSMVGHEINRSKIFLIALESQRVEEGRSLREWGCLFSYPKGNSITTLESLKSSKGSVLIYGGQACT